MIDMHDGVIHRGDVGKRIAERDLRSALRSAASWGELPRLQEPAMVKLYDPIGIALLGFGVLAVAALAFVY